MKHSPFKSPYLLDFVIHEERQGNLRLYPSTAELPALARALRLEFESMLPPRIRQTDQRGDDFRKIEREVAAELFCDLVNRSRPDGLQLFHLLDRDRVAHPAIVQHIFRDTDLGTSLTFKFYVNDEFFEEIRLCGRRLVLSRHTFERFHERAGRRRGNLIKDFLGTFFSKPMVALPCGGGDGIGIYVPFEESIIALPIREADGEFFVPTFLDIDRTNTFEVGLPAYPLNLHYGTSFTPPKIRNWDPVACMVVLKELWKSKARPVSKKSEDSRRTWGELAYLVPDLVKERGHGPGSRLVFLDNIPGPCSLQIKPEDTEMRLDEVEYYTKKHPGQDWATILAKRDAMFTVH